MAIVGNDFKGMDKDLSDLLDFDQDLTDWETDFINSLVDRLGQYGKGTIVSEKQLDQLERLKNKYL